MTRNEWILETVSRCYAEKSTEVYRFNMGHLTEIIIMADELERRGLFDKEEDKGFIDSIFYLNVIDLNSDDVTRNKILTENSSWLQSQLDKEGYLRQKVNIKLYQKFRFTIKDSDKGVVITVSKSVGN